MGCQCWWKIRPASGPGPLESIVSEIPEPGQDRDDRQATRSATQTSPWRNPPPTSNGEGEVEADREMIVMYLSATTRLQT